MTVIIHAPACWVEVTCDREAGAVSVMVIQEVDGEQVMRMGTKEPIARCAVLPPPVPGAPSALMVGGFYLTLMDDEIIALVRNELGALH